MVFASRKPEAEKFQNWVYHDVLPSIRKTGTYTASQKVERFKIADMVLDIGMTRDAIQKVFGGVKDGVALAQSVNIVGKFYGHDLSELKVLIPSAEHETGYMNATQLGKKVGKTAREVNQFLKDYGLQFKDGKDWRLTDKGKQFGEEFPYDAGKHSGYQIRWGNPTVELFLESVVH